MAKGRKPKKDTIKVTHEPHQLSCVLSEAGKAEAADQLAKALEQSESLALEKKNVLGEFTSRANALAERIHRLAVHVRDGVEIRSVDCELRLNYTALTAILFRPDTEEIVEERAMTDEEKQMKFDL